MKSNELKVGNWVYSNHDDEPFKVRGFDIGALDDGMDCESMQPIPLTPEILEKAGFVLSVFPEITEAFHDAFTLVLEDKGWDCIRILGKSVFVNYVHELQNLYFALTGEELNIQL
jgi:hypothetical protein